MLRARPEHLVGLGWIDQGNVHRGIIVLSPIPFHRSRVVTYNCNHTAAHVPDEGGGAVHILEMRLGLRLVQSHFHAGMLLEHRRFLLRTASRKKL